MKDIIFGQIRHGLTLVGGMLVAGGYTDANGEAALVGGAMALVGMAWSFAAKKGWLPSILASVLPLLVILPMAGCGINWQAAAVPGAICALDAAGQVQAIADGNDPDGVKALNAAVATGATLQHSAACQAAIIAAATPAAK